MIQDFLTEERREEMRYVRAPEHDKRIRRGDDWAGDAWIHIDTGKLTWCVVGHTPCPSEVAQPGSASSRPDSQRSELDGMRRSKNGSACEYRPQVGNTSELCHPHRPPTTGHPSELSSSQ